MKFWIVLPAFEYEGFGEPLGIFSSKEEANLAIASVIDANDGWEPSDGYKIFEYIIGEIGGSVYI